MSPSFFWGEDGFAIYFGKLFFCAIFAAFFSLLRLARGKEGTKWRFDGILSVISF